MFCKSCGNELREGAAFCPSCGAKVALAEAEPVVTNERPEEKETLSEKVGEATEKATEVAKKAGDTAKEVADKTKDYAEKASEKMNVVFAGKPAPESEQYLRPTPHNPSVLMSYDKKDFKKPEEYRNVVAFFLLMFLTLGIYSLYQFYRLTKITNDDESMVRRGPGAQLALCIFVPFYSIYWMHQTGKRIENLMQEKTGKMASLAVPAALFTFFGLGPVALTLIQNNVNKIVGGITGQNMDATGIGTCKQCGCYFPNDVRECPNCGAPYTKPFYENTAFKVAVVVVVIILAIWLIASVISAFSGLGSSSRSYSDYDYYYSCISNVLWLVK